jgi:hypothetical protein
MSVCACERATKFMQICSNLKRVYMQAACAEGEVPQDTAAHQEHPLGWFPQGELEQNCERIRQEELLELEREEAILAAAREDLAKILNLPGSDDEDGMVRQMAGTELLHISSVHITHARSLHSHSMDMCIPYMNIPYMNIPSLFHT